MTPQETWTRLLSNRNEKGPAEADQIVAGNGGWLNPEPLQQFPPHNAHARFTFFWTKRNAWEGRDYVVEIGG